eukprot:TRINITY_DN13946_c0_g1_i3.p1 TRINITY_DN13946_c0_g1~~TRINITY_DN13946_c0_g1_i3.p1  ORF type:complete len:107 (+),score=2.81 TRINITY_DN13946_c0_g1_i3:3-323(+)
MCVCIGEGVMGEVRESCIHVRCTLSLPPFSTPPSLTQRTTSGFNTKWISKLNSIQLGGLTLLWLAESNRLLFFTKHTPPINHITTTTTKPGDEPPHHINFSRYHPP